MKFCTNCIHYARLLFTDGRCLHPEENINNASYLETGKTKDARLAEYARASYGKCSFEGKLHEEEGL